jgi:hypothetical protein
MSLKVLALDYDSSYGEARIGKSQPNADPGKNIGPYPKNSYKPGDMVQVIEHLPGNLKALNSNPRTAPTP